jgi:hypothetical protein
MTERRLNKKNMENKTIYAGIVGMVVLALFMLGLPLALAEDVPMLISANTNSSIDVSQDIEDIDAELNETVSSWQINKEKMKNWFTFNQEKKTERELKIAKMLLIEARIQARNNNTNAMEKSLEAHNRILEKLQERIGKINQEPSALDGAQKVIALERAIQAHEATIARWQTLLENESLTEEQIAKIELKIQKAENMTAKLGEIQEAKRDKFKVKLMAIGNLTDEEAESEIEEAEENHNMSNIREIVKESREQRKEQRESQREERKNQMEALREQREQNREGDNLNDDLNDSNDDSNTLSDSEDSEDSDEDSNSGNQVQAGQN